MGEIQKPLLNRQVELFIHRNELSLKDISMATVPAGLAWALGSNGFVMQAAAAGVVAVGAAAVVLWRKRPALATVIQEDWRDTDYSPLQKMVFFAPLVVFPLTTAINWAGVNDSLAISVPPVTGVALSAIICVMAFTFAVYGPMTANRRMGRRRAQQVSSSLDGVTASALDSARQHSVIVAALAAIGAVDELWVTVKRLGRVLQQAVDFAALDELDQTGVVKVRRIGYQKEPDKWSVTLTAAGVRVARELPDR